VCCICRWDEEDVVLNIFVSLYIKYVVSVVVRVGMCERENPCGTQKVFFFKIVEKMDDQGCQKECGSVSL